MNHYSKLKIGSVCVHLELLADKKTKKSCLGTHSAWTPGSEYNPAPGTLLLDDQDTLLSLLQSDLVPETLPAQRSAVPALH